MATKKSRYIPTKNYFIAGAILIGVILLFVYAFSWYNVKNKEELINSYLLETNTVSLEITNIDELKGILLEEASSYFIFTGYTGDKDEKELEEDLKPIIDEYNLNSIFYYFNVTDLIDDDNFIDEFNSTLDMNVKTIPSIIYIKDGKVEEIIDKDDSNYLKAKDFEELLKENEFEKGL